MNSLLNLSFSTGGSEPRKPSEPDGIRNPPDRTMLDNWVFDNFKLNDEPFPKVLQILETCIPVNNNLFAKLASSPELPITFDERFKIVSVLFFIPDFNLLSCEVDNFTFRVSHFILILY